MSDFFGIPAGFLLLLFLHIRILRLLLLRHEDVYKRQMCNNVIENAAVTLAAPVLLAFNAVNNLFGVGSSSMMSRALGKKDYDTVYKSSAFGFYCALLSGAVFALLCGIFQNPLLKLLGADANTMGATVGYMKWTVVFGAVPAILNVVLAYICLLYTSSGGKCTDKDNMV